MNKKIIKIAKILLAILIIYTIYCMGMTRGIILGISVNQQRHNESVCDFLRLERDTDGFCLLKNETYKYRWYKDCGYEKFKIKGERAPPFLVKVVEEIRSWIYYPATGC